MYYGPKKKECVVGNDLLHTVPLYVLLVPRATTYVSVAPVWHTMAMTTKYLRRIRTAGMAGVLGAASLLTLMTHRRVRHAERRYPPQDQFVSVDNIRLHYLWKGIGRPVVLVHGDGGSVYDWTLSIFDQVTEQYQAVAFDRPGFGYSERPRDGASPVVQARLLYQAITALGLMKPVLVGHSRGGSVVAAYAVQYPNTIAGVVTLGGGMFPGGWAPPRNKLLLLPVFGSVLAHTVYVPWGRRAVEAGLQHVFAPDMHPPAAYVDAYAALVLRPIQLKALADDQVHGGADMHHVIPQYADLRVPWIVINGQDDRSTPLEDAWKFHRMVPTSELVEVPNSGHELMFTHPNLVMHAIETVFARADVHAA